MPKRIKAEYGVTQIVPDTPYQEDDETGMVVLPPGPALNSPAAMSDFNAGVGMPQMVDMDLREPEVAAKPFAAKTAATITPITSSPTAPSSGFILPPPPPLVTTSPAAPDPIRKPEALLKLIFPGMTIPLLFDDVLNRGNHLLVVWDTRSPLPNPMPDWRNTGQDNAYRVQVGEDAAVYKCCYFDWRFVVGHYDMASLVIIGEEDLTIQ